MLPALWKISVEKKKKKSVEEQSVILMSLTELFNRCVAGIEGGGVFIV